MNPDDAIDFSREAIKTCMMVGGPILLASLLIGLLIGVFQAMTQVQDQTVSFVPKILLLIVLIGLCLPWLTDRMMGFAKQSFEKPMSQWAGTSSRPTPLFSKPSPDATQLHASAVSHSNQDVAQLQSQPIQIRPVRYASSSLSDAAKLDQAPEIFQTETFGVQAKPVGFKAPALLSPQPSANQNIDEDGLPTKSPFILPHYRTIKTDNSDKPDKSG